MDRLKVIFYLDNWKRWSLVWNDSSILGFPTHSAFSDEPGNSFADKMGADLDAIDPDVAILTDASIESLKPEQTATIRWYWLKEPCEHHSSAIYEEALKALPAQLKKRHLF